MLYHCGLLDDDRTSSRPYSWAMRRGWHREGFPPDVLHDIRIWLNMPGFDVQFHAHNLHMGGTCIRRERQLLAPDFETIREDVAANWLSATREDCIKICKMRVGKAAGVPLICQMSILDDLKAGLTQAAAARVYGVTQRWVSLLAVNRAPVGTRYWHLPPGFEILVQSPSSS